MDWKGAMNLAFWKRAHSGSPSAAVVQTGRRETFYGALDQAIPLMRPEVRILRGICDAVPLVGAAVDKLVHLVGGFHVECDDPAAQTKLERFLEEVPVGSSSVGADAFLSQYLEQLLVCGTAVGEMVLSPSRSEIAALYNAPLEGVELGRGESPLDLP